MNTQSNELGDAGEHWPVHVQLVDATGLACPLPILRAKKALAQVGSGEILKVITTDKHAVRDFQAFAEQTGNRLERQHDFGDQVWHFLKRR